MDEHSSRILALLKHQLEDFRSQRISLEELQSATESIGQVFQREPGDQLVASVIRLAGALEHVRWMALPEDQFRDASLKIEDFEVSLKQLGVD